MEHEIGLKSMVLAFRVTELQTLLSYAGKNRSGRKNELQARALELVKTKQGPITSKIKELYKSIQLSALAQQPPASSGVMNPGHMNSLPQFQQRSFQPNQINSVPVDNGARMYGNAAEKTLMGRNPYAGGNFSNSGIKLPGLQSISVPICPDIQLKKLPFYDILHVLHKPASLIGSSTRGIQDSLFTFCFTPSQAKDIASSKEFNYASAGDNKIQYTIQVQLRFCALDTSADQDDQFPPSMVVKVNGKLIPLPHPIPSNRPGVEPKRPSRPLNVTNYCKLSPTVTNNIQVSWTPDVNGKGFCIALFMVKKLCSSDLLGRLKAKGSRPADFTRGMIKEICMKDDADCCIATTSLKVSIACPLGKSRMSIPSRASTCSHLQCFDANLFIQMNEKKPLWVCPVCDKPTLFDNLAIDGYFEEVISKVPIEQGNDIEIDSDATWRVVIKKDKDESGPPTKKQRTGSSKPGSANDTICLDDDIIIDDDVTEKAAPTPVEKPKEKSPDIVDLTLSSDSEEEAEPPLPPPPKEPPPLPKQPPPPPKLDMKVHEPPPPPPPPVKEKEKIAAVEKQKNRTEVEDGEVKGSSDEEEVRPVRRQPSRLAKPTFLHDESSSSSNASDSSASTRAPSPQSPQCITLESESSRSPTPEPRRPAPKSAKSSSASTSRSATTNYTSESAGFLSSNSAFSAAPSQQTLTSSSGSSYSTSLSYPTAAPQSLPNPRYNGAAESSGNYIGQSSLTGNYQGSSMPTYRTGGSTLAAPPPPILRNSPNMMDITHHGMTGMGYGSSQSMGSYLPPTYDTRATWDASGFTSAADFASLEYPSMDYFNQTPTYGSNPGARPGHYNNGSGYGGSW